MSARRENALALGLALLPVAVVLVLLAHAWWTHDVAVANLRAAHESAPTLRAEIAALRKTRGAFYANRQASDAAARMKADMEAIVATAGGTVLRDDVVLAASGEGPTELQAEIAFRSDTRSLSRVLYRLRHARPLLFVTRLTVHAPSDAPLQVEIAAKAFLSPS